MTPHDANGCACGTHEQLQRLGVRMAAIAFIHILLASVALVLGPLIFLGAKGTRRHVLLGRAYAASMVGMNVTALFIYRLFGRFGPFHVLALVSLATVFVGYLAFWRRRSAERWLEYHYRAMSWSYVGLAAAGVSEAIVRIDVIRTTLDCWIGFGIAVFAASFGTCLIGGWLIARFEDQAIRSVRVYRHSRNPDARD